MSFARLSFEEARIALSELVELFMLNRLSLEDPRQGYTETETRVEFIDKFLIILGWDVNNQQGLNQFQKEVALERTKNDLDLNIGRPDYRLKYKGNDLLPVEAKKPAVKILESKGSAIQARSYGWTLSLPAAVLTNFASLAVYDTSFEPQENDSASVARIPSLALDCTEYVENFEIIWKHLSFEKVSSPEYFSQYNYNLPPRGTSSFDKTFITQFGEWRLFIASNVLKNNPSFSPRHLGQVTQKIVNAMLFLRVCEDRNLIKYEKLLDSARSKTLLMEFRRADQIFNAGLFTILDSIHIPENEFIEIVSEMYWPRTKFAFGVLAPEVLASLYEHYLSERIEIDEIDGVRLVPKPELIHAGGVVPTPQYIVQNILNNALPRDLSINQKPPRILDIACGSGIFLLEAFNVLVERTEINEDDFHSRKKIVEESLFGMDIDPEAVEITKLSLQLAILGDTTFDADSTERILPNLDQNIICGNTLIGPNFDTLFPEIARIPNKRAEINPHLFPQKFLDVLSSGKFDCVIGNPPYVRIQALQNYFPNQLLYFKHPLSGFRSSQHYNFDLYLLFIEKSIEFLSETGSLGMIVPNRITNGISASSVRELITPRISKFVHFGELQVFPGKSTYTALLFLGPENRNSVQFELISDIDDWRIGKNSEIVNVERKNLGPGTWPISSEEEEKIFACMEENSIGLLGDSGWAEIFVGVQTSADALFFIVPKQYSADGSLVSFLDADQNEYWIERLITRPAIRDQKIEPYGTDPEPDSLAIFPYDLIAPPSLGGRIKAQVYSEVILRKHFPLALQYFKSKEKTLKSRSMSAGDPRCYWAYGRSQSLAKMTDPKLIVRVLSLQPSYAIDNKGLVVPGGGDGGPYYLLRPSLECKYSLEILQAILSNEFVDKYIASRGRSYRGSYIVHRKAFISKVPVPDLDDGSQHAITQHMREIATISESLKLAQDVVSRSSLEGRKLFLINQVNSVIEKAFKIPFA